MVYTDKCPVLSNIEWRDNCQFPVICDGETPSDWKKRIWGQLMNYRNNNRLIDSMKWYIVARKMEYMEGFSYGIAIEVNIAICYSCDQFVYVDKRVGYEFYHKYKMEEHWRTNCIGNKHCDISFKEYMELKQKPEAERDIFTRLAIHRPDGLCASQLAEHYKLLWAVREEMRQVNNV
nr:656_t:CDS:2 [Entrophospora candida]